MAAAVCVIFLGLLAGEELIVRWGVQPALAALDDRAHLQARIALVQRLKVAVPFLIVPAVLATVAHLALDRVGWTVDRPALRREFPDVAFHDFESWAKAQDWKTLLQAAQDVRPRSQKENQQ